MQICGTLNKVQKQYVDFDPTNPKHMEAFKSLCLGELKPGVGICIKQHEYLRFNLEHPFEDVRTMMFHKVGQHFVNINK